MAVLVDGTVLPMVRSYSVTAINKQDSDFDVVIVENATVRKKLSAKYAKFDEWLKFEPEDAVVFKVKKKEMGEYMFTKQLAERYTLIGLM
jgi:predicted nucleotidyltransferase